MDMIDQALANGIRVLAWTFDELYVLRDEAGNLKYVGRGDAPARITRHGVTPGKDDLMGEVIWPNNLTKAQAKGLEQRLIDHFGGALRQNPETSLLNVFRSYAPTNLNAPTYRQAATDQLWSETIKRLRL